ncbi:MAG: YtxH domain-containing protein [Terriglobia bacterium]
MAGNGGSKFSYFLAGMGIGAAVALLFAPHSGEETREYLRERADEARDEAKRGTRRLREQAEVYTEKGKDLVERQRESLEAALEAGKQAYREEKRKM